MKTNLISLIIIALTIVSCNTGIQQKNTSTNHTIKQTALKGTSDTLNSQKGYELISQKCFICHMEKPDRSKQNQMIAPPMQRVQQHYKPAYPNRDAFVKAVMNYVNQPSKETTLMPGAVKRFHLMPKLPYNQNELRLIAETLYHFDFKNNFAGNRVVNPKLTLNQGKKWKLDAETLKRLNNISIKINKFSSSQLSGYRKLGKEIFVITKTILLDANHKGEAYTQLQYFFHSIEDNMHALMAAPSVEIGQQQLTGLKIKFKKVNQYFN